MLEQEVLAVRREALASSGLALGFTPREIAREVIEEIYSSGDFHPRGDVEKDPNLLQPIPCAVVHWKNKILALERQEKRRSHSLHGRLVLWAGGHVDIEDARTSGSELLENCLERELGEELQLTTGSPELRGLIYDGRSLHFAIVYDVPGEPPSGGLLEVSDEFRPGTRRSIRGTFVALDELEKCYDRLESWSKLILSHVLLRKSVLRSHVPASQLSLEDALHGNGKRWISA